jgi:cell division protein FtsL
MARNRKTRQGAKIGMAGAWILVLFLFMAELLFYTWCRVQCVQVGIAIGQENRKQQELKTFQNSLKIELARLKAPERISQIARNQLGLNLAEPQQVVLVP